MLIKINQTLNSREIFHSFTGFLNDTPIKLNDLTQHLVTRQPLELQNQVQPKRISCVSLQMNPKLNAPLPSASYASLLLWTRQTFFGRLLLIILMAVVITQDTSFLSCHVLFFSGTTLRFATFRQCTECKSYDQWEKSSWKPYMNLIKDRRSHSICHELYKAIMHV